MAGNLNSKSIKKPPKSFAEKFLEDNTEYYGFKVLPKLRSSSNESKKLKRESRTQPDSNSRPLKKLKTIPDSDINYYICDVCDSIFTRECQLKQHIERSCRTFWDTLHPSKLKKQRSSLKGSNIRSLKTVPDSSIKYYRCNACGIKFARKVKLKQHKTKNHAEEKHLLVVLENLKSIPFNKNELKMKPSKRVCGFTFECFLYSFSSFNNCEFQNSSF